MGLNLSGSLAKAGEVLTGDEVIRQRLFVCIFTRRGTVPLFPKFGTDLYLLVGRRVTEALATLKDQITECIVNYLPDVTLERITTEIGDGSALDVGTLRIVIVVTYEGRQLTFSFIPDRKPVAYAEIPYLPETYLYEAILAIDGTELTVVGVDKEELVHNLSVAADGYGIITSTNLWVMYLPKENIRYSKLEINVVSA